MSGFSEGRGTGPRSIWTVHLGLLATAFVWGGNYIALKIVLQSVSPLALTFVRFSFLCAVSLVVLARAGLDPIRPFTRRELALAAASGACGYLINPIVFALGIDHTSAFSAAVLSSTTPLFSALGLGLLAIEPVTRRQWLGSAVAFAGIAAFLYQGAAIGLGRGDLYSLASGLCFAAYGLLNKPLLANHRPTRVLALCLVCGGLPLLAVCLPAAIAQPWSRVGGATWALIAYSTVLSILTGHLVWNWAISRVGVARTVPYSYLPPVLAGVGSASLLGESFGVLKLAGAAAVLAGLSLGTLPRTLVRPPARGGLSRPLR